MKEETIIVNTAKAFDLRSGKRLSEIIGEELRNINFDYAFLAGGTITKDLFVHEPLGSNVACKNNKILNDLKIIFESDNLFIYTSTDLAGTEYAAAFKNVISILAGITNGLGFSYGSETHIISNASPSLFASNIIYLLQEKKSL